MKKFFKRLLFWIFISLLFFVAYFVYTLDDLTSISKGFPIDKYKEKKLAVLVIDVQEGYTGKYSDEQAFIDQSSELIKQTNRVISMAHESGVSVVYIQQHIVNRLINWLDGYSMAPGSPGVAIDERIKIVSLNTFKKRKSDSFSSHDLDSFLRNMKINVLVITGLDIAECAYRTSVAALNREFKVYVVEEAVISKTDKLKQEKLKELQEKGATVIAIDELHQILPD